MCGISGEIRFDGTTARTELIQEFNRALHHRGPDGNGVHIDGSVGFGHTRLAIIDPKGGHQPMVDGPVTLTFNGEIYNFKEIIAQHFQDTVFSTSSDTELILKAYEKFGIDAINEFRGMFAFALYDQRIGKAYIVRDRIGIKPLYYSIQADRIVFASELPAIMADRGIPDVIDSDAIAAYLHLQYVPTPMSIYKAVRKLEPGRLLEIDVARGTVASKTYWAPPSESRERPDGEILEEFEAKLAETVSIYVRSDVPFGSFLSGGIDSTLVTQSMAKILSEPPKTFSIGFNEPGYSELPFAAHASEIIGCHHHVEVVDSDRAAQALQTVIRHLGEPFADSSAIPTYFVSKMAAEKVKMVLSGDGGDEVFGGYEVYRMMHERASRPLNRLLRPALRAAAILVPWPAKGALLSGSRLPKEIFVDCRQITPPPQVAWLTAGEAPPQIRPGMGTDVVLQAQVDDIGGYMANDILTKVDRMSMACSLEVRVPLLDHHLVEFGLTLPLRWRLPRIGDSFVGKPLLRRKVSEIAPASFVNRAKMGFGIPLEAWLVGLFRDHLEAMKSDWSSGIWEHIRYDRVRLAIQNFLADPSLTYTASTIWSILALKLWHDEVHLRLPPRLAHHHSHRTVAPS